MSNRILPSRFYHCDPADLADELIAARDSDATWEARRLMARLTEASAPAAPDRSHRYRGTVFKQQRIRALLAAVKKGKA